MVGLRGLIAHSTEPTAVAAPGELEIELQPAGRLRERNHQSDYGSGR